MFNNYAGMMMMMKISNNIINRFLIDSYADW